MPAKERGKAERDDERQGREARRDQRVERDAGGTFHLWRAGSGSTVIFGESVGRGGRVRHFGAEALAAHFVEVEHIEEMHRAEDEEDEAELGTEELNHGLEGVGLFAVTERERDEAEVDEIEADDEQVVDRGGHGFAAAKRLNEEDVAVAMKRKGFTVTGSDTNVYPPMSDFLRNEGIVITEGYRAENLPPDADVIVIGNAISRGNEEAEAALWAEEDRRS